MLASRVDLLSQMLELVRLQGELVFSAELNHPWALRFEPGSAYFFVVLEGSLIVQVADQPAVEAITGDLVMLPRGVGHILRDGSDATAANASELMEEQFTTERLGLRHGGNGEQTKVIAGAFHFESAAVPWVVSALPAVIHIEKSGGQTAGWLEGLAYFMMMEAQTVHPGSSVMISRLIDVLIIRVIRTWAQTKNASDTGWLGALADPRISRALKAIHDEPFRKWTVADLASAVGMSRSGFAERFSALVKEAPLSYQNRWRLTLAHGLLRQANARVSDVARQVGYDSDAAFSRAFKAQFGIPPVGVRSTDPRP
jgi:AraC-like DNA-binding protein